MSSHLKFLEYRCRDCGSIFSGHRCDTRGLRPGGLVELHARVNALPGAGVGDQRGKSYYVRLDDVLDLIESVEPATR